MSVNFFNENNQIINHIELEREEQILAETYIKYSHIVLELGARYGTVSHIINSKIENKNNQVSVEPDYKVWSAIENNKKINNSQYNILKGFISNRKLSLMENEFANNYGIFSVEDVNSTIPSYTLDEVEKMYKLKFNVLVADCEGYLESFFDENPYFYDQLVLIIYEADRSDICNYKKINNNLISKNFINIVDGFQNVWCKNTLPPFFNVHKYIKLNDDISHMTDDEATKHYICHGKYEKRIHDFDVNVYKEFSTDIGGMSDEDATIHFVNHGKYENRLYNILSVLPIDFNIDRYITLNPDIKHMSKSDILEHYYYNGRRENRHYK